MRRIQRGVAVQMIKKKVFDYVHKHHMLAEGDYVVAGVSGGADSVCLLFMLLEMQKELPIDIHVVHINHKIREDAESDSAYVKTLCEKFNIPFTLVECDVQQLAKQMHISTEEAGRNARYEAFYRVLEQKGGGKIAIAHNKNDCCETFLFHLFRGSSLRGLSGISPVRDEIIRPLMCLERHEIEAFLEQNGIKYCIDSTNLEDNYTRNKIRHRILETAVREISPAAVTHINDACGRINEAYSFIGDMTRIAYKECAFASENGIHINLERYQRQHPVIQGYVIMKALEHAAGSKKDLEAVHVEQVKALFQKQCGRKINLPYHLCAERDYTGVLVHRTDNENKTQEAFTEYTVSCADKERLLRGEHVEIDLGDGKNLVLSVKNADSEEIQKNIPQKKYTKWIDYDKIKDIIVVRTRKEGDYLTIDAPGGAVHKKTLKSYLIDRKVPAKERGEICLVAEKSHVLWVVGERISSFYKISGQTTRILELELKLNVRER